MKNKHHFYRKPVCCLICKSEIKSSVSLNKHIESHNLNPIRNSEIFLNNKYTKLYFKLLEQEEYGTNTEKHHIIPRSLGGDNSKENIIRIRTRKHFLCHYLLCKMVKKHSSHWYSMVKAFSLMKANPNKNYNRYNNSKLYEYAKNNMSKCMSKLQKGSNNSSYDTIWINNPLTKQILKVKKHKLKHYTDLGFFIGKTYKWKVKEIKRLRTQKVTTTKVYLYDGKKFYGVKEIAKYLNIHFSTVRWHINKGKIKVISEIRQTKKLTTQ